MGRSTTLAGGRRLRCLALGSALAVGCASADHGTRPAAAGSATLAGTTVPAEAAVVRPVTATAAARPAGPPATGHPARGAHDYSAFAAIGVAGVALLLSVSFLQRRQDAAGRRRPAVDDPAAPG